MKKPNNLKECIILLDLLLSDKNKEIIKNLDKISFTIGQHFGMGLQIRNNWGLWDKNSELYKYFKNYISFDCDADTISRLILESFYDFLQGKIIDFDNCIIDSIGVFNTQEEYEKYHKDLKCRVNNK